MPKRACQFFFPKTLTSLVFWHPMSAKILWTCPNFDLYILSSNQADMNISSPHHMFWHRVTNHNVVAKNEELENPTTLHRLRLDLITGWLTHKPNLIHRKKLDQTHSKKPNPIRPDHVGQAFFFSKAWNPNNLLSRKKKAKYTSGPYTCWSVSIRSIDS